MARIKLPLKNYIPKEMKAGGAVSLITYLAATKPEMLNKIVGDTAIVKHKHLDEKHGYKYIELPLGNNQHEELRVFGKADLEEGDEVSILSIVVMFLDNGQGQTLLRYDARFSEDFSVGGLRTDVFRRCAKMLCDLKKERITKNVTYEGGECPRNDFGIIRGYSDITIITSPHNRNYYCDTINAITIRGYTNASPLAQDLIIAEKKLRNPIPNYTIYLM